MYKMELNVGQGVYGEGQKPRVVVEDAEGYRCAYRILDIFSLLISLLQYRRARSRKIRVDHTSTTPPYITRITPRRTCRGDASTRLTLYARLVCCWCRCPPCLLSTGLQQ
jgi:hypothetical protein